jgi:hypothetical protein
VSVYVFTGPTLAARDAAKLLDAVFLPPVAQGDVIRVVERRPTAIGIIDGFFERMPAVWHKEILWAMTQGAAVFGSASMGALRAAELAAFGMRGVGRIFELFSTGELEDDDEVAIAHASAEYEFQPLSEAMVNIRATLDRAERERVVKPAARQTIETIAKALYYPRRAYPTILEQARERGVDTEEVERFAAWLPRGRVDQKREDAVAMLAAMADYVEAGAPRPKAKFWFEHTEWWDRARRTAGSLRIDANGDARIVDQQRILDEAGLAGGLPSELRRDATLRVLAVEEARRSAAAASADVISSVDSELARRHELKDEEAVERWCARNDLDLGGFRQLVREEAQLRWVQRALEREIASRSLDCLRLSGEYPRLAERARAKAATLYEQGLDEAGLEAAGVSASDLLAWWFGERLEREIPADLDEYAIAIGFDDYEALERALVRELLFGRVEPPTPTGPEAAQA